jgi:hypothetical protein
MTELHPIDWTFALQLPVYAGFFAAGTAAGFALAKVKARMLQACLLVGVGLAVGGFLGYVLILGRLFDVETHVR